MACQDSTVVINQIFDLYDQISTLESLKPSKEVNTLFTQLLRLCETPTTPTIEVSKLPLDLQQKRSKLVKLCGEIEGLFEKHYSTLLATYEKPLDHLDIFPIYSNYLKLGLFEYNFLTQHLARVPERVAFIGSGAFPLSTVVLARDHLPATQFDNYDLDPAANEAAVRLVGPHSGLAARMRFHTRDVMALGRDELGAYDVLFLAVLVGTDREEKARVVRHLADNMAPGSILMTRSARGARALLYPAINPEEDVDGFEVLSVFHPTNEGFVNSIVVARKPQ